MMTHCPLLTFIQQFEQLFNLLKIKQQHDIAIVKINLLHKIEMDLVFTAKRRKGKNHNDER